jgi:hypothetical protein
MDARQQDFPVWSRLPDRVIQTGLNVQANRFQIEPGVVTSLPALPRHYGRCQAWAPAPLQS